MKAFLFLLVGPALFAAPSAPIPDAETLRLPTPQRLSAILAAAQREGWPAQVAPLRAAAQNAYQHDKLPVADGWFMLYRWTTIWAVNDYEYVPRWMEVMRAAHADHPNLPKNFPTRRIPLGFLLSPELQLWMLENPAFSEEFFSLLTPFDYIPGVLQILNELHFHDPAKFKTYPHLALAIALVYDVPPPPQWPHGQVAASALPRKLPKPLDAFLWWTKQDELGRTFHRLNQLGADELKFVVDAAAPFTELEWAQQVANYPLNSLSRAYTMVRYDGGRVQRNDLFWGGGSYALDDILAAGGICVDQAYFATEVGKARGVPTLLFRGEGIDSRHAWFGFLDAKGKWQLDAGRYAEQRFVTGFALDPQTWGVISDHELKFLSERFRSRPSFVQSRIHVGFAADFVASKDPAAATQAARKAIAAERRNLPAWELLLAAEKAQGDDAGRRETILREAAQAFHGYADLEAAYLNRLGESMRARGEAAAADLEQGRLAQKNQRKREDLSLQSAQRTLTRSFATQSLPQQIQTYHTLLASQGKGAGIAFFDQVVLVFVEHLLQLQEMTEATKAVEVARQTLKVDSRSQLAAELEKLSQRIKAGP